MNSREKIVYWFIALGIHAGAACMWIYVQTIRDGTQFYSTTSVPITVVEIKKATGRPEVNRVSQEEIQNDFVTNTNDLPSHVWFTHYLPASQLDVRPQVINDIDSDLLANFRGVEAQSLDLVLLINEYGDVDHVIFDAWSTSLNLPDSLLNDLRQRFMEARFLPGSVKNQSVASKLRIRVHLD